MNIVTQNLYLNSILSVLADNGFYAMPAITHAEKVILEKAHELACGSSQSKEESDRVDSIFSHLHFKGKTGLKKSFPVTELKLTKDFFPGTSISNENLKLDFQNEVNTCLQIPNLFARAETLLFLLQKYATTLPSGIASEISLYDFAKSKAAFAQCLTKFPGVNQLPDKPFLLVGGDMSGIQEFLYDIVSTNASKNLKGRSYYLHLLGDTILTRLLDILELPLANVVFASGGSFYVLAPNTDEVVSALIDYEKTVNEKLFSSHKTGLSFIIDSLEFSEKDPIGTIWDGLNKKFDQKKRTKFKQPIQFNFSELFEPSEVGGETRRDVITGEEIYDDEQDITYELGDAYPDTVGEEQWETGENLIRKETAEQIFMGLFLKSTMFRMSGDKDFELRITDSVGKHRKFLPGNLGLNQYILDTKNSKFTLGNGEPSKTLYINKFDIWDIDQQTGIKNTSAKGFELYGGNAYPTISLRNRGGEIYDAAKTFSELAGLEDNDRQDKYISDFEEAKFKRLGVLRMDVDNLGLIFKEAAGLRTLAHYSALSRQLDWFFKGYLNTLWEQGVTNNQKWKEFTQIIYSGGDDLFIVGKWDCLIEFAEKIRDEFSEWTCKHEALGISGGIILVTPKFPIIKAAEMCEQAEKNAKKHRISVEVNKNAISLFDYPLNWTYEWNIVKKLKEDFVRLAGGNHIPKSLLMMLAAYHELKTNQIKMDKEAATVIRRAKEAGEKTNEQRVAQTWRWQIAYNLTRQKQRTHSKEAYDFIENLITHILVNGESGKPRLTQYEYFDFVAIAVRWAEYELRSKNNTDHN